MTFEFLNLAEDSYPSLVNNTNAMDVVLCRNVLMYFTPGSAARVVDNIFRSLVNDGWLLVAPSESSQVLFRDYAMVGFPDAIFYRKSARPVVEVPAAEDAPVQKEPRSETPAAVPVQARPHMLPVSARPAPPPSAPVETTSPVLRAQELADQGKLAEAREVCDRAIVLDPVNPSYRFLRAMVEQELGMLDDALTSLEQALYLDQAFVMAHFALGNVGRRLGRHALSRRHFRTALKLADTLQPETQLPESGGLSAARLAEFIRSTSAEEAGPP